MGDAAVIPAPAVYAGEVVLYGVKPRESMFAGENASAGLIAERPLGGTERGPLAGRVVGPVGKGEVEAETEGAAEVVGMRARLLGEGVDIVATLSRGR